MVLIHKFFQFFALLGLLALMGLNYACSNKQAEPKPVDLSSCDTTGVTYAAKIQPIFQSKCYACHSAATANSLGAGYNMEDFAQVERSAQSGILEDVLYWRSTTVLNMPLGGNQLPACELKLISAWIRSGAANN